MRIGYACKLEGVQGYNLKTCILKNATPDNLKNIIEYNLSVLDAMLEYNYKNEIYMFRISSDIIPLASHKAVKYDWKNEFKNELKLIGEKAIKYNIRLSMHPGQYTVLNSPDAEVVKKAIADLNYHCEFLDAMNLDCTNKLILHIGGVYGDKASAKERFIENYNTLNDNVKKRLVIENDDKLYTIKDVLEISSRRNIPVVFDNLHNEINNNGDNKDDQYWIDLCKKSWKKEDGTQKIHYSQQDRIKRKGAHSKTIDTTQFLTFVHRLNREDIDIMLEVKDKNLSAIKCSLCMDDNNFSITVIEKEWARYKYIVLEKSHQNYLEIRELLKDKDKNFTLRFYQLIDQAILNDSETGFINASEHVWGYFKNDATIKEKHKFKNLLDTYSNQMKKKQHIKHFLFRLSKKYNKGYLIDSYFFVY